MRLASHVDALAVRLPEGDPRKAEFRRCIAAFADECGCTMGGIFLAVAAASAVGYLLIAGELRLGSGLLAIGFVFGASLLGKATGLGVARIRLLWLRRVLAARLASVEVGCVDLH